MGWFGGSNEALASELTYDGQRPRRPCAGKARPFPVRSKPVIRAPQGAGLARRNVPGGAEALGAEKVFQVRRQGDQLGLHDIPDDLFIHAVIAVDEPVAEPNNPPPLRVARFEAGVGAQGLAQGLADDAELPLDGGSDQIAGGKSGESLPRCEGLNAAGCFPGVQQPLGDFSLRKGFGGRWRWSAGGWDCGRSDR